VACISLCHFFFVCSGRITIVMEPFCVVSSKLLKKETQSNRTVFNCGEIVIRFWHLCSV